MLEKFKIDFPAFTGIEKRNVFVYLPLSYDGKKKYPVLYAFDGHNLFKDKDATYGRAWRLDKYLDKNNVDLIVIGVECNQGKHGERENEYSPFEFQYPKRNKYGFYGKETMDWFVNELKPFIDKKYKTKTDRENTFIMGSSMGGIMASYALINYNNVFSRACSLSPAYFLYKDNAFKYYEIKKRIKKDSYLYTDYGTKDLYPKKAIPIFNGINTMFVNSGINVTSRIIYEGVHHETCWEKQLVFAINVLMYK
ncbi:MAG: alpha/beta hydrolase-fold protein [Erysipelotrichaceae bacterium]|nr:alpha/beta hydrolase-fold protein [Erysipelotrichaceae bacterium]